LLLALLVLTHAPSHLRSTAQTAAQHANKAHSAGEQFDEGCTRQPILQ
jgi:hypothetical protein